MGGPGQGANIFIIDKDGVNVARVNAAGQVEVDIAGATISATVDISGQPVKVSGETVYFASGRNDVQISGQRIIIGNVGTSNTLSILTTTLDTQSTANPTALTTAMMHGYEAAVGQWSRVRVTESGSYDPYRLKVAVSGETVSLTSGTVMHLGASGQGTAMVAQPSSSDIQVSNFLGLYTIAHLHATAPGVGSRTVRIRATMSGDNLSSGSSSFRLLVDSTQAGSTFQASPLVQCTDFSGGTVIGGVRTIHGLTVKNLSGNAPVYVGGVGTNAPFSGKGYMLFANEEKEFKIQSASGLTVFATVSGQYVSWYGIDF